MNQINKYPPLSIMIKPVSGDCNLNCSYCFYMHEIKERNQPHNKYMSIELMKLVIDRIKQYPNKEVSLVFQGGEPLLRGINFYKEIFDYSEKLNIHFSIQTNGLLLNKQYCDLFKKYNCLVGLSIDGDKNYNKLRKTKNGLNSFDLSYRAMKLLQKEKVPHNCLIVINKQNVKNIKTIFNFFKDNDEKYLQFIPCLSNGNKKYVLSSRLYGKYLLILFDCYYKSYLANDFISVRNMDNYLNMIDGKESEQCGLNGRCSCQYVIESNGDIYPCDFYCLNEFLLGNIINSDFKNILENPKLKEFLKVKETPNKCKKCQFYLLCRGGCKRENEDFDRCKGTKLFFNKCLSKFDILINNGKTQY